MICEFEVVFCECEELWFCKVVVESCDLCCCDVGDEYVCDMKE